MNDQQIQLSDHLVGLDNCPHCGVAKPEMELLWESDWIIPREKVGYGHNWASYRCTTCNLVVLAQSELGEPGTRGLLSLYPTTDAVDEELPERAKQYLGQAIGSLHAPDGAVMLAGSAVDAMLKDKNYKEGTVYARIDAAVIDHVLTEEMGKWANEVRLDSNRPRHSDDNDPHASSAEARQAIEFVKTLGLVLYVLPSRVESRGLEKSPGPDSE